MGRAAKESKDRTCRTCKTVFTVTANELKRHAKVCEEEKQIQDRLNAIGLYSPGQVSAPHVTVHGI